MDKNYNGTTWEYEELKTDDSSELPKELVYEIIGTQRKILFVEGTKKDSLDYQLYKEIYTDYHVVPCGSCEQVITYLKAKNAYNTLNPINVKGIIDRDYRTEEEIEKLRKDNIFTLNVAEVENLFIVPEVLALAAKQLGFKEGKSDEAQEEIRKIYSCARQNQISKAFARELAFRLSRVDFNKERTPEKCKEKIDEIFSLEEIKIIQNEVEKFFPETNDIKIILKVFNDKSLSISIGKLLTKDNYKKLVIRCLRNNPNGIREKIKEAIELYLPQDLPPTNLSEDKATENEINKNASEISQGSEQAIQEESSNKEN